jgi:phenylalanyl-tRNA synthetase beta chain
MQFSFNWLGDYLELPAEPSTLAEQLTTVGFAVEGIEVTDADTVLDVDVTTNRPDCMNYLGLAREAALALGTTVSAPAVGTPSGPEPAADAIAIAIEPGAAQACPRYVGVLIEGVTVGPSPRWLQDKLRAIGSRPINNIVDITNFVLWETGQPLHAFDRDRLGGRQIRVRFAQANETLTTLDGEARELNDATLVIADEARPVALAGIMGGLDSEVTGGTVNVLLESAHFSPGAVRGGAAHLGVHTDASHRFERGADPAACLSAAWRAATLIQENAGGDLFAPVDVRSEAALPILEGELSVARLAEFAGLAIDRSEVERILGGLSFEPQAMEDGDVVRITVPSWRYYDFAQTDPDGRVWFADLAEEVMRHVGFAAIPAAVAPAEGPDAPSAASYRRRLHLADHLSAGGYLEAFNFAFGTDAEAEAYESLVQGGSVRLANPISERYEVMRRSLIPGLLESALYNLRRGADGVQLFEVGHVFAQDADGEVSEREVLAVIGGGVSASPWDHGHVIDLLDVKGALESLGTRLGVDLRASAADRAGLVRGTSGVWRLAESAEVVGQFGLVSSHDEQVDLFAAELLAGAVPAEVPVRTVRIPSRYPGIAMDLTLTHPLSVDWATLRAAIDALRPPELADYRLKVRYRGQGVPAGAVATTISFTYQSDERSLTQDEVNARHLEVRQELERRFGVTEKENRE